MKAERQVALPKIERYLLSVYAAVALGTAVGGAAACAFLTYLFLKG